MARSKKLAAQNGGSSSISTSIEDLSNSDVKQLLTPSSPDRPTGPLSVVISPEDREVVKVNNASLTELKNACDDAVKRVSLFCTPSEWKADDNATRQYLSRPDLFKQIHLHTDIRLGLGWLSVFVAAGTALYGYKIDFEKSKPVVTIGLVLCASPPLTSSTA